MQPESDIDVGATVHAALKFLLDHVHKTSDPPNQAIAAQHSAKLAVAFEPLYQPAPAADPLAEISVGIDALYPDGVK